MLTIYGVYRSRASRCLWMAGEAGLPFRHVPVIQAYRLPDPDAPGAPLHTRHPDFLRVNPAGQIPALEDDGLVLAESLAITLYLAKRHGGALGPADLAEDARMTAWAFWAATEVESRALEILYGMLPDPPAGRGRAQAETAIAALRAPFALLDAALAGTGWLVGGRFTVADLIVAEVLRYAQPAGTLFAAAPRVAAWIAACQARPACRAMLAARAAEPA